MISRKVAHELRMRPRARNNLENRGVYKRVGFDPVELWVMGPPCGLKARRVLTFCMVMIARQVRGQPVSYVGNNFGTKGEEQREPFSYSLRRGGPIGNVLVHRWLPECHQQ